MEIAIIKTGDGCKLIATKEEKPMKSCIHCKNDQICHVYKSLVSAQQATGVINDLSFVLLVVANNCDKFEATD